MWRPSLLTVPNLITVFRLALLPFLFRLSYSSTPAGVGAAALLFAFAAWTDWLDGYIARRHDLRSAFGALLDPVVDKVMVLSVLFVFADRGMVPLWLVLLNMLREFVVTGIRQALCSPGVSVGANWMGKVKYCQQVAVAELVYLQLLLESWDSGLPAGRSVVLWSLVAVTVLSFVFLFNFARWHRTDLIGSSPQNSTPDTTPAAGPPAEA